jgi:hypothetical protein
VKPRAGADAACPMNVNLSLIRGREMTPTNAV